MDQVSKQNKCIINFKQKIIIIIVGLNNSWKIPIAYCVYEHYKTGIIIKTLTFDDAANNLAIA